MELIEAYLYNRIPLDTTNISNRTFHSLKRNGWYNDVRTNAKFTMLNKRININDTWYRVLIRFETQKRNMDGEEVFHLSIPTPFVITECQSFFNDGIEKWKDITTYHGPKLGSVSGFLEAGVPSKLIDRVYQDMKDHISYN